MSSRVAAQRDPAERPLALAEQRAHIGGHEAGEVEGVLHAGVEGHLADVVAVVHRRDAHRLEVEHGLHVHRAALGGGVAQRGVLAGVELRGLPAVHAPAGRQVAVDQVVRAGLVGHQVGLDAARLGTLDQFGQHLRRIAEQADRHRLARGRVLLDARQRVVQVRGLLVEVAGAQAEVDARLLALDVQAARAGEGRGQRLRAAHAAQAGGEDPLALQAATEMLAAGLDEGLVGALHDALAADVDPAAGRHLAVHHQALAVEFVEVLPGGPLGHQVGVGDQHARRVDMGAEHAHRLAALHQQRLVLVQLAQRLADRVEAVPVARRLADAAIDHQRVGVLGHFGVEVVLQHAVGGFDQPVLAAELAAARGAHHARLRQLLDGGQVGHAGLAKLVEQWRHFS